MGDYIGWSETEWATQEERLAVDTKSQDLFVGIPLEHEMDEHRVALTPHAVMALTAKGHRILVERGAGEAAGFSDHKYSEAGAEIANGPEAVFKAQTVLKVSPPTQAEIEMMPGNQTLISALQLRTRNRDYFKALADKNITALALEEIRDESDHGALRIAMSEIAGRMAAQIGASLLSGTSPKGKGKLLGAVPGVASSRFVVIGAGAAGLSAARAAMNTGAQVIIMDESVARLRYAMELLGDRVITESFRPKLAMKRLRDADVAVGAVAPVNGRTPMMVSQEMVEGMEPGSVIIDISIDQGGVFETSELTSHDKPTVLKHGVIHYGVPNIASSVGQTASIAMSNVVAPLLESIAEMGGVQESLKVNLHFRAGLYLYNGLLTKKHLGEFFDLPFSDDVLLF